MKVLGRSVNISTSTRDAPCRDIGVGESLIYAISNDILSLSCDLGLPLWQIYLHGPAQHVTVSSGVGRVWQAQYGHAQVRGLGNIRKKGDKYYHRERGMQHCIPPRPAADHTITTTWRMSRVIFRSPSLAIMSSAQRAQAEDHPSHCWQRYAGLDPQLNMFLSG